MGRTAHSLRGRHAECTICIDELQKGVKRMSLIHREYVWGVKMVKMAREFLVCCNVIEAF